MLYIQLVVVGVLEIGNRLEPAVVGVGPTVIGADKDRGVARVCPSQPVATVPADILPYFVGQKLSFVKKVRHESAKFVPNG